MWIKMWIRLWIKGLDSVIENCYTRRVKELKVLLADIGQVTGTPITEGIEIGDTTALIAFSPVELRILQSEAQITGISLESLIFEKLFGPDN